MCLHEQVCNTCESCSRYAAHASISAERAFEATVPRAMFAAFSSGTSAKQTQISAAEYSALKLLNDHRQSSLIHLAPTSLGLLCLTAPLNQPPDHCA